MSFLQKKSLCFWGFLGVVTLFLGATLAPLCWGSTIQMEKPGKDAVFPNTDNGKRDMSFVTVNGMQFEIDGDPFYFTGANFWSAMNLASLGAGGDRARLDRELDFLASQGVTVLRVMAGTEGPDACAGADVSHAAVRPWSLQRGPAGWARLSIVRDEATGYVCRHVSNQLLELVRGYGPIHQLGERRISFSAPSAIGHDDPFSGICR